MKIETACKSMFLVVSIVATTHVHANLLTNGSFEQGTFTNQGNATESFAAGATTMTGWTTTGRQVSRIGPGNPWGSSGAWPAQDGNYFLDLTGYLAGAPFGGVTQTVATTPGQQYDLSFYIGSLTSRWGGPPVSITASVGGSSQTFSDNTTSAVEKWTLQNFLFTASGSSTVITLTGAAGVNAIGLDNVILTAVPEPSTWVLMLLGVAALGFGRSLWMRAVRS